MRAAAESSILRSCGQLSSACMIASKCLVVDGVSYGDGVSSPWSVDVGGSFDTRTGSRKAIVVVVGAVVP